MFYVRTADRLQRTSVWMENLEGGLEYLKQVVLEDSLSIGEELEQHMADLVETYQCEWKSAVEDPEKRKRFREFVNAPLQRIRCSVGLQAGAASACFGGGFFVAFWLGAEHGGRGNFLLEKITRFAQTSFFLPENYPGPALTDISGIAS